jgi:hypothetical protein
MVEEPQSETDAESEPKVANGVSKTDSITKREFW